MEVLADLVFDGERWRDEPVRVVVEGDRIAGLRYGLDTGASQAGLVIDARGRALIPGLVNTHVHSARGGGFEPDEPPRPAQVVRHFGDALAAGVTTVGDMGCPPAMAAALRAVTSRDPLTGPGLVAAGPILTAPDGYPLDWMPPFIARLGAAVACGSERDGARAVQGVAEAGMDHVKLAVMHQSYAEQPLPAITTKVGRAIVAEAHRLGLRVLAHAHSNTDYRVALASGVDALMHSSFEALDDELVRQVVDSGVPVCPTLWVFESVCLIAERELEHEPRYLRHLTAPLRRSLSSFAAAYRASGDVVPEGIAGGLPKSRVCESVRVASANLALLHDAGVPIAFGNDSAYGFSLLARPVDELAAMQRAGLDASACFRAATSEAAKLLGLRDRGRIAEGARADLVVLPREARTNIEHAEQVYEVVAGGRRLTTGRAARIGRASRLGAGYARGMAGVAREALLPRLR